MSLVSMIVIMLLSSALSTMNVWADKLDDIRFSINDVYMAFLMTGWMCFFMGLWYNIQTYTTIGICSVLVSFACIRTQAFVSESQYVHGMIPHHSMAVHMSKKLLEKTNTITPLVKNIIETQNNEIATFKTLSV